MKFQRMGNWYELSDCRRYTVAAIRVGGFYKFEAWRLTGHNHPGVCLGIRDSSQAARALCTADLAARASKPSLGEVA